MRRVRALAALDPTNARWEEYAAVGKLDVVDLETWSDSPASLQDARASADASLARIRAAAQDKAWRVDLDGRSARQAVVLADRRGDKAEARRLALALLDVLEKAPGPRSSTFDRSDLKGFALLAAGRPSEAVATLSPRRRALSPASRDVLARAYLASGRRGEAEALVGDLKKHGYAHPAFLAFWRDSPVGGKLQSGGT
jgi:hypothetical protein